MLSVEMRTYNGGIDVNTGALIPPHSFMVVTGPDGLERGYGLGAFKQTTPKLHRIF